MSERTRRGLLREISAHPRAEQPLRAADLPDPDRILGPHARLTVEQVRRFRQDFLTLLLFAAEVCERESGELAPSHLMEYLGRGRLVSQEGK